MADKMDPPPLFENVDIIKNEENDEDLFVSAMQEAPSSLEDEHLDVFNGEFTGSLQIGEQADQRPDQRAKMETVPIASARPDPHELDTRRAEEADQFLDISISESQKVGDGMGAYVAYRVSTHTNMPLFKKRSFSVMRRFSDFLGLHDKLTEKYLRCGRIIPPAPEKSVIGMTKIKMSAQPEQGTSSGEFVEKRRASLERYLRRTAAHPVLSLDPDFREFLESDVELPKATQTSALSGAGVMRLFNKVGETVNKITYKMDESDPWFEEKIQHVECLDAQLRKLHASVEALVANRRELAALTAGVSKSAAMLSSCEEHNSLSRVLNQLADTEERVENLHVDQANTDFYILSELLKDYIGLLGAIKDAFHERAKVFQHWQHSQQMLTKRRENKAKLELNGRQDKLGQAAVEVIEWEAKVERGQDNFDKISKMIKLEIERFEECRVEDFKSTLVKYLENHMEHQAQLVKIWESFLPEAKAIV